VAYLEMRPIMISLQLSMRAEASESKGVRMWRKRCDEAEGTTLLSSTASCSSSSAFMNAVSATWGSERPAECVMPRTKTLCWARGALPIEPRRTTALCEMEESLSGAQPERRSSSRRLKRVG